MKDEQKNSTIKETLKSLNSELGEGTIDEVSNFDNIKIERIPTGSYAIDFITGGGLPKGRIIEIYGQPSSGKSVLSLFMIKEVQNAGGKAAYLDVENSFAVDFAKNIGVNTDRLIYSQAVCAEDVLKIVDKLIKTNELDLIVVDSVASLVPSKELEGEVGEMQVALQARIMSQALRIITGSACKTRTSLIFINQIREKVGVFYGNPNTTPGGKALKFYSSIRLEVKKGKDLMDGNEVIGNIVKIEATKNKTAAPFRKAEIELFYRSGIDKISDLFDEAVSRNVIVKTGNTMVYKETKLGVGRDQSKEFLKKSPEIVKLIIKELNK